MKAADGEIGFGKLRPDRPTSGPGRRRDREGSAGRLLAELAVGPGEPFRPHAPRAGGGRLRLALDRGLARWRDRGGAGVFELLGRALASEKAGPDLRSALSDRERPLLVTLLDRSERLVVVEPEGRAIGLNRSALSAAGLGPAAALVAAALVHGLRAAARLRAGGRPDPGREPPRDVQNFLMLLVGVRGTEWEAEEVARELSGLLDPGEPFLAGFRRYAAKLGDRLEERRALRLCDRVYRDGALFERLPAREKRQVVLAGVLAWYGWLSLGLLRPLLRRLGRGNPFADTAWWIFRARPGGRRLFRGSLLRRGLRHLTRFRVLKATEYVWASYNPILTVLILRPVYRAAGGNGRPFRATMAAFAFTAFVVHPLWITLTITGAAALLGAAWPWIATHTRIASRENLILHAIVISFWLGIGLVIAVSKTLRRLLTASGSRRSGSSR